MSFLNATLLFGLVGLAVPLVVHLFSRRKYDVVDWPAMQFLQWNRKTRRKISLEQLVLMLVRMAALAVLVLAFAAPQATSTLFGTTTAGGSRDVVVLIDGSASMGYKHDGQSAADAARQWASAYIGQLQSGDRVAVFQIKNQSLPIVPALTTELNQARNALELLSPAKGVADWPSAVQAALVLLEAGHPNRDVVVITDNQRFGWGDETTAVKWELLKRSINREDPNAARIWVVNVAPGRPANPSNWSLDPITTSRGIAVASRNILFRSAVQGTGMANDTKPGRVLMEVDGKPSGELKPNGAFGQAFPLSSSRSFATGSHLVTFQLEADGLPSDNRQDYAIDVLPLLPVLIVDGARSGLAARSEFLRDALAPAKDPTPTFLSRTVFVGEWSSTMLSTDLQGPGTAPQVLILSNIEKLTGAQQQDIERFLQLGGSVLVTLGERCDAATWNRVAFRAGQGFLPARLVQIAGDESDVVGAPKLLSTAFAHPAFDIFKEPLPGGLHTAVFPKRWKLDTNAGTNGSTGNTMAMLSNRDAFFIERSFGKGRVILAAHPLDSSWKSNLIRLPDFVRLAHELVHYLASTRSAERNLVPGQPLVFQPRPDEPVGPVSLVNPDGRTRTLTPEKWPLVVDGVAEPGAYNLSTPTGRTVYFAVRNDSREAVLTPNSDEDKAKIAELVGKLKSVDTADEITANGGGQPVTQDLWWLLLLAVLVFLTAELWYARRLTRRGVTGPT